MSLKVSIKDVSKLKDISGAGMMDCKNALKEAEGDFDKAVDILRAKGIAKSHKRSGNETSQGFVAVKRDDKTGAIAVIKMCSETDFVARNDQFISTMYQIVSSVLSAKKDVDLDSINSVSIEGGGGENVGDKVKWLSGTMCENIVIKDALYISGSDSSYVASYVHSKFAVDSDCSGMEIGSMVSLVFFSASDISNADADFRELTHGVAMHVAGYKPFSVSVDNIDQDFLSRERAVYWEQVKDMGKPKNVLEKIVEGKISKFYSEVVLMEQSYVKSSEGKKVSEVLSKFCKEKSCKVSISDFKLVSISG